MIHWDGNTVAVAGNLTPDSIFALSQSLNVLCERQGYKDVTLDFSRVEVLFGTTMVPLIAQTRRYVSAGIEFEIIAPETERLKSLFHNCNWNHLINPRRYEKSTFEGLQHLPAVCYRTANEQYDLVNKIMEIILGNMRVDRKNLRALEWCVNEITDNVLNHANSQLGGVLQLSTFPQRNVVEFVVADAGDGVRRTLGGQNDGEALTRAIQEGVTRDTVTNQGNGLYGSFRVAVLSGGSFQLHSGRASLVCRALDDIRVIKQQRALFPGTVAVSQIVCNDERLIERAFVFDGKMWDPGSDYIEQAYEAESDGLLKISMNEQGVGFGSREAGKIVRTKLLNLLGSDSYSVVEVNFAEVYVISSSFADEVIGKTFVQ